VGRLNREIWGWAFYDFANSAFAVSVLAVVFQLYFVDALATSGVDATGALIKEVTILGSTIPSAALWPWTVFLSMIFIVVMTPLVGAIADYAGKKKRFLIFFCYTGVAATMLMVHSSRLDMVFLLLSITRLGCVSRFYLRNRALGPWCPQVTKSPVSFHP